MVRNHRVHGKAMERDAEERVVGKKEMTVDGGAGGEVNVDRVAIVASDEDRGTAVEKDEA